MNHSFLYQNNQNYRDQKLYSKLNEVGIQFEWIPPHSTLLQAEEKRARNSVPKCLAVGAS